ncbi:MAG: hypothetical protein RBT36_08330, partial [Desulfobulbus sp.]|nr:hypothetical protein [Desulfobulbus sp.]
MSRLETNEFRAEYLREVGSFLPLLIDAIHALEVNPADRLAWAQMRRLVHLFCEASAAAGVDGLIHMAACMETAMDRFPVGVELQPLLVAAMTATVERFEGLIRGLERGELVDHDLLVARTREDFVFCAAAAASQA